MGPLSRRCAAPSAPEAVRMATKMPTPHVLGNSNLNLAPTPPPCLPATPWGDTGAESETDGTGPTVGSRGPRTHPGFVGSIETHVVRRRSHWSLMQAVAQPGTDAHDGSRSRRPLASLRTLDGRASGCQADVKKGGTNATSTNESSNGDFGDRCRCGVRTKSFVSVLTGANSTAMRLPQRCVDVWILSSAEIPRGNSVHTLSATQLNSLQRNSKQLQVF